MRLKACATRFCTPASLLLHDREITLAPIHPTPEGVGVLGALRTKSTIKSILKKFFKWLHGMSAEAGYPEEVRWISTKIKMHKRKLPEDLLTPEDVDKLARAADRPRDEALVRVLYESGCRIGEFLTLSIRNVTLDEYGAVLHVHGKTGPRRVRIIHTSPILSRWLSQHPMRDDPDAPLWVTLLKGHRTERLSYVSARKVLVTLTRRAGIKKRVHAHLFRHSRATELAGCPEISRPQMCEYLGWNQETQMAGIYIHLSGASVDDAILRASGITVENAASRAREKARPPVYCVRCKTLNGPEAEFCQQCDLPLNQTAALRVDEENRKDDEFMNRLVKHPKFQELMREIEIETKIT